MLKVILLFAFAISAHAQSFCEQDWSTLALQHQGRTKPYLVVAKETIRHLTGKSEIEGKPATELFCLFSFNYIKPASIELSAPIDHVKLRELLNLKKDQKTFPLHQIPAVLTLLRAEHNAQKLNDSYKKSINALLLRYQYYQHMIEGKTWTIPVKIEDKIVWHSLSDLHPASSVGTTGLSERLLTARADYVALEGDRFMLEVALERSHVFSIAMLLALVGIFVTVLSRKLNWGIALAGLVVAVEIVGMTLRVLISGRAPITNMYETVMFSGFGALVIALIITYFRRDRVYVLAGLGYNTLCLFMMKFSGGMLDSSISPLVPVLRDNFWLSTHVTTIILSYAALALSWMLANITLIRGRFGSLSSSEHTYYVDLIYTSIKVGAVLLVAGIILGGVWADYSWGRFWGWDPKETWSLIVFLFYMAVLHGKYTNWINGKRFVNLAAFGFLTVMMAWFGVNYILAAGLHSYGFSEGGAIFLGTFFLIQIAVLIVCNLKVRTNA